jgi:hypothetical protein
VGFAANDIAIELDDDAAGTDLQLFKEPGDAQPVGNLFFFSVEINLHENAKNRIHAGHVAVAREYGFKFVPRRISELRHLRDLDSHASLRRSDPDQVQRVTCCLRLSVCRRQTPLAF